MDGSGRRIVILAEGTLDFHHGKTAMSLLRYCPDEIVAVIDSEHAGQSTGQLLGLAGSTPILTDITVALPLNPNQLLIGIAPRGGDLPSSWRQQILIAIRAGLDVVSGLHYMLNEDDEFVQVSQLAGVRLIDVRHPPADLGVNELLPRRAGMHVVSFVGSDCAAGKMTAALEITAAAERRGLRTAFVATGQTGIMLEGSGISIDRVIGDFMAGAAERLVLEAGESADWIFVEGQGSLLHPAYSGVTLSLLHGSAPDAMILVHQPGHDQINDYPVKIPPLDRLIQIYEQAAGWVKPARVVGIALNTRHLSEDEATRALVEAKDQADLPVTDPVRFGGEVLVEAIVAAAGIAVGSRA